jgi:hypothetical protein
VRHLLEVRRDARAIPEEMGVVELDVDDVPDGAVRPEPASGCDARRRPEGDAAGARKDDRGRSESGRRGDGQETPESKESSAWHADVPRLSR